MYHTWWIDLPRMGKTKASYINSTHSFQANTGTKYVMEKGANWVRLHFTQPRKALSYPLFDPKISVEAYLWCWDMLKMFPPHVTKLSVPKTFAVLVKGFLVFLIHPVLPFLSQTRWQILSLFIGHIVAHCFAKFLKPCLGWQKDFWFSIVTWPCTCHCGSSILEFLLEVKEPEIRCDFKVLY